MQNSEKFKIHNLNTETGTIIADAQNRNVLK